MLARGIQQSLGPLATRKMKLEEQVESDDDLLYLLVLAGEKCEGRAGQDAELDIREVVLGADTRDGDRDIKQRMVRYCYYKTYVGPKPFRFEWEKASIISDRAKKSKTRKIAEEIGGNEVNKRRVLDASLVLFLLSPRAGLEGGVCQLVPEPGPPPCIVSFSILPFPFPSFQDRPLTGGDLGQPGAHAGASTTISPNETKPNYGPTKSRSGRFMPGTEGRRAR